MSDDEVVRIAGESGFFRHPIGLVVGTPEALFELARRLAAAEREACAKVCEERAYEAIDDYDAGGMHACAEAIRTRGQK